MRQSTVTMKRISSMSDDERNQTKNELAVTQQGPEEVTQQGKDDVIVVMHETCNNQQVQGCDIDSIEQDLLKTENFGATFDKTEELTVTSGSASDTVHPRQLRSSQEDQELQDLLEVETDSSDDDCI
jgi:hypothetical protein